MLGPHTMAGRVDGVVGNVGGRQLAEACHRLATGSVVVAVGKASREPTALDSEEARIRHDRGRLETLGPSVPPDAGRA